MNIAIIGAGNIAIKMADTINAMTGVKAYAVASRSKEKAEQFAKEHKIEKAYGSYEEMLRDDNIDLVYIAVPHTHHYICAKMCLEAGKNVICEKPFFVNAKQAKELVALSEKSNLLLTEAIWTRYMPSRTMIDDIIKSGVIGEVTSLTANLGYEISQVPRILDPNLAGGALLDLGVYLIHFARMVLGEKEMEITANAVFQNGVDMIDTIELTFDKTKVATMQCSAMGMLNRSGAIFGRKGYIEITNINNPEEIRVYNAEYQLIKTYEIPKQITGFEYQIESCVKTIANHQTECPEITHDESIKVMEIMDQIRASWGYEIPEITQ